MARRVWQNAHDDMLLRLIEQGGVSFSAIAIRINDAFGTGYTRDSIAGRTRKLRGGEGRSIRASAPPPVRPRARAQQTKPGTPGEPHVAGIPLGPRKMHQCGWPINDGGPFLFCGMPKTYDPTYCDYHRWLATPPGSRHHLGGGTP
jgi:hypothetical protein